MVTENISAVSRAMNGIDAIFDVAVCGLTGVIRMSRRHELRYSEECVSVRWAAV
jgi:hypothetical protein